MNEEENLTPVTDEDVSENTGDITNTEDIENSANADGSISIQAEDAPESSSEPSFADEILETQNEPAEYNVPETEEKPVNPAAKKSTALYIVIISILVIAIIALVALLISNNKDNDTTDAEPTQQAETVTGDETETPDDGTEAEAEAPTWSPDTDYGVTVEIQPYDNLIAVAEYEVPTEEDIDLDLDAFAENNTEVIEITDRTDVQMGDIANIDYAGTVDGVAFDGGTDEGFDLTIGSGRFIPGFEEALIGHNVGETFDIDVTFPDDYNEELAGKAAVFKITINSISIEEVPELNDEFIMANTDCDTLAAYREEVRERMLTENKEYAESEAQYNALTDYINSCTFTGDIDKEISDYYDYMIYTINEQAQQSYGIDGPTLYSYFYGWTEDEYYANMKDESAYKVKYTHILDKIIEEQGIELTTEEYDECFNDIFITGYGYENKEAVLAEIPQEEIDNLIKEQGLYTKAQSLIQDNITIEYKEITK